MEDQHEYTEKDWQELEKRHRRGKITGGLLIVTIGSLFMARELDAPIAPWVFTWKMLLIGLGLIFAVKHKFRHPGWLVLVGVGGAFLLNDLCPHLHLKPIIWSSLLILLGLVIIFKPRRKYRDRMYRHWRRMHRHGHHHPWHKGGPWQNPGEPGKEDFIDSTSFMAGVKKNVLSKKFRGGDITNVFGGTELNLMQADIEEKATLEVTQVMGGTKLIIPANWEIRSELVTVFGSVEDKRPLQSIEGAAPGKLLLLTGTTFFGGIEIRSY